jgi:glyoxylase-like metal-dependent hydrolase (beta-lactamase superfamily II)
MKTSRLVPQCLLALLLGACATPPPVADPVLATLADGVWLLPGKFPRDRQPDGNSLVLQGRDGLIVIDSGRHAEHTQALLDFAARRGRPIAALINTHWHLDHLGGNARLRDAIPGLEVIASPETSRVIRERYAGFSSDLDAMLRDDKTDAATREMIRIDQALMARGPDLAPTRPLDAAMSTQVIAGRELTLGHESSAVSGGDLWILDRTQGLIAVGDLVTLPVPFLDTACASGWVRALARVDALPFERLVPGHGPVMDRAMWRRWRTGFEALVACAASDAPVRACSTQWIDNMGPLLSDTDPRVAHGMLAHYFASNLRSADRDKACRAS